MLAIDVPERDFAKGRSAGPLRPVETDGAKFMLHVGNEITHTNSRSVLAAGSARRRSYVERVPALSLVPFAENVLGLPSQTTGLLRVYDFLPCKTLFARRGDRLAMSRGGRSIDPLCIMQDVPTISLR